MNVLFTRKCWRRGLAFIILVSTHSVLAQHEPIPIPLAVVPQHIQTYEVDSGIHDSLVKQTQPERVFQHTVTIPNAPWLRLHFEDYDLGGGSYVTITALEDGAWQRLDAKSISQWNGSSAYFNGDAVEIELHVAPRDQNVFLRIADVRVGEQVAESKQEAVVENLLLPLCGNDTRIDSDDPAVARIMPAGCTGWIGSNGSVITAGHCDPDSLIVLEFNVPDSEPDGTINHPGPEDQYSIDPSSITSTNGNDLGNDWAVFGVSRNATTGLTPVEANGEFYRMTRDRNPPSFRVTGYGIDNTPPGPTGGQNAQSRTLQTDAGANVGETIIDSDNAYWQFRADIESGSSGSPIVVDGTNLTVGVVTHGGCDDPKYNANHGTSFENDLLEDAVRTFPGTSVTYVDNGHTVSQEDGGVLRPFDTVSEGVNAVSSGGILSVVTGTYSEALTINKAMRIEAPVGTVRIDPNAPPSLVAKTETLSAGVTEGKQRDVPEEFSLAQNHPNPVTSETQIAFALPEAAHVSLVLYDVLGREVSRLVDSEMEAGAHTVPFDASGLPGGVYVYRVQAGDFVESRRMLVVR